MIPDFGFSGTVNEGIAATFPNTVTGFQEGFSGLSKHIEQAGFNPQVVAERYLEDTGRMVAVYLNQSERIDRAENSLLEAAVLGGAQGFRMDIFEEIGTGEATDPALPDGFVDSSPEDDSVSSFDDMIFG